MLVLCSGRADLLNYYLLTNYLGMRKLLSCLMVVFIGATGSTQTNAENLSVSIKTNFEESFEVTTHSGLLENEAQPVNRMTVNEVQASNSIFRITSCFEQSNAKVLCAEKLCAFIYFIKNNLLKALSNEVMCLV